jgi:TRAP-type C4-dicarboxylate transport system permease small subunit
MFELFDRSLQRLTAWLVVALAAAMTVSVLLGVFFRYVLNDSLSWSEELARYCLIWMSWLGASLALRRGGHIAVEFAIDALPPKARRIVVLGGECLTLAFLLIVLWYGIKATGNVARQSTIALGVSMAGPYASVPAGAALLIYNLLVTMVSTKARLEKGAVDVQT